MAQPHKGKDPDMQNIKEQTIEQIADAAYILFYEEQQADTLQDAIKDAAWEHIAGITPSLKVADEEGYVHAGYMGQEDYYADQDAHYYALRVIHDADELYTVMNAVQEIA